MAPRLGTSYSRGETARVREISRYRKTLVSLIIIQQHSGYCVPVITVSYERLGRVRA